MNTKPTPRIRRVRHRRIRSRIPKYRNIVGERKSGFEAFEGGPGVAFLAEEGDGEVGCVYEGAAGDLGECWAGEVVDEGDCVATAISILISRWKVEKIGGGVGLLNVAEASNDVFAVCPGGD